MPSSSNPDNCLTTQLGGMWQQTGDIWEQRDSLTIQELVQVEHSTWQYLCTWLYLIMWLDYLCPGLGLLAAVAVHQ